MSFEYVISTLALLSTFNFFTLFNEEKMTWKEYAFVSYYFGLIGVGMADFQKMSGIHYGVVVLCWICMANLGFYSWQKNRKK